MSSCVLCDHSSAGKPTKVMFRAGDAAYDFLDLTRTLIRAAGDDPDRPGLLETPKRFAQAVEHWFAGYKIDPASVFKSFADGADGCDQLVLVRDIPFWSHCEHHIAPFFGTATIAYLPNKRILGLSKFKRLVDVFALRLQVQERLTNEVANALTKHLEPQGCGVFIRARHSCMESRGVKTAGSETETTALRGCFLNDPTVKAEFLAAIGR